MSMTSPAAAASRNLKKRLNLSTASVPKTPRIWSVEEPSRSTQRITLRMTGSKSPTTANPASRLFLETTRSSRISASAIAARDSSGDSRYMSLRVISRSRYLSRSAHCATLCSDSTIGPIPVEKTSVTVAGKMPTTMIAIISAATGIISSGEASVRSSSLELRGPNITR